MVNLKAFRDGVIGHLVCITMSPHAMGVDPKTSVLYTRPPNCTRGPYPTALGVAVFVHFGPEPIGRRLSQRSF